MMRNEYSMAILPSLDISSTADLSSRWFADIVVDVWRTSLDEDAEMEYAESNGLIYIPRATEKKVSDHELKLAGNTAKPVLLTLGEHSNALTTNEPVLAKGYIWTEGPQCGEPHPLMDTGVEVEIEFIDLQASGHTLNSLAHAVGKIIRKGDDCIELSLHK